MFLLIFPLFLEKEGKEREKRNIYVKEKHGLIASETGPHWGLNLKPFGVQNNAITN